LLLLDRENLVGLRFRNGPWWLLPVIWMEIVFGLGSLSAINGIIELFEQAKVFVLATARYAHHPFATGFVPINTGHTSGVGGAYACVPGIVSIRNFSKIANAVVLPIAVDVVQLLRWPRPVR
jgi:hypothetical protein